MKVDAFSSFGYHSRHRLRRWSARLPDHRRARPAGAGKTRLKRSMGAPSPTVSHRETHLLCRAVVKPLLCESGRHGFFLLHQPVLLFMRGQASIISGFFFFPSGPADSDSCEGALDQLITSLSLSPAESSAGLSPDLPFSDCRFLLLMTKCSAPF